MQEIMLGYIGTSNADGSVRLDMAIINDIIYKVEIHQNKSTFVKVTDKNNKKATPNAHVLRAIQLWAGHDTYAGLNLQDFIKKVVNISTLGS